MNPQYLYKYRKLSTNNNLASDNNIKALFNFYVMLSSRKKFKDKDDSKIKFNDLNKTDIFYLRQECPLNRRQELETWFKRWLNGNLLTPVGRKKIKELKDAFDKMVDNYAIYCLGASGTNIHMWEKYTNNHAGFCIEFNSDAIPVTKVKYREKIAEISILNLIKPYFGINDQTLGEKIHSLLHIKLNRWKKEDEYRFVSEGSMVNTRSWIKKYDENLVSSIIFGSRMRSEHKKFITKNYPLPIIFKQAIENMPNKEIKLENYDENKHLNLYL